MGLTRRGKRRLLAVSLIVVLCGAAAVTYKLVGRVQQQRLLDEARSAGLAAYAEGDLDTALARLSEFFTHTKDDLEVNLAFADARASVPLPNGQHLLEALDLFNARCLKLIDQMPDRQAHLDSRREVLGRLLELYELVGMRFELVQTADGILQDEPDCIEALSAKGRALYADREFDQALPVAEKLCELEPGNLAWRQLQLEIMHRQNAGSDALLAACEKWIQDYDGDDGRFHLLKASYLLPLGRAADARTELAEAARLGAGDLLTLQQMVSLMDRMEMYDLASQVIAAAGDRFPNEQWVAQALVQRLWQAGRIKEALAQIEQAERRFPQLNTGMLRLKALALASADRRDGVQSALAELRERAAAGEDAAAESAWADAVNAGLSLSVETRNAALETFQNALSLNPDDAVLHLLAGQAHSLVGEHALAVRSYELAHRHDPDWAAAGMAYSNALLGLGRVQEAYDVVSRLLNRMPAEERLAAVVLYSRAHLALLKAGGSPTLNDTKTGTPRDLADLLLATGQWLPNNRQIAALTAEAYIASGRSTQARQFIESVIAGEDSTAAVLLALADVSKAHGLGMAVQLVRRAQELEGMTLPVALAMAEALTAQGRAAEGIAIAADAIKANPEQAVATEIQKRWVALLLAAGHPDAGAELAALVDRNPNTISVQTYALAQPAAWENRSLITKAIGNLKRAIGESSQQVRLAEATELVTFQADDEASLAKAIMLINGVLEQSPHSLAALSLMADASMRGEHPSPDRAIEHLETAVAQYPGEASLYPRLVSLLQRSGDYESASSYLKLLSQHTGRDPRLWQTELRLLQSQGDFEGALVRATELLSGSPGESEQLALAAMYVQAGRFDEAAAVYDRLLGSDHHTELTITQAAEFLARIGQFKGGLSLIESINETAGSATRSILLGTYHQRHGDPEDAERWLLDAVEKDPSSPSARNHLARFYLDAGEPELAHREATAGLKANPDDRQLRGTLAASSFDLGGKARGEAISLLRELDSENDDLLATLELLERIPASDGRAMPTAEHLKEASRLLTEHSGFMPAWHLGVTLNAEIGRLDEAVDLAHRAMSRFPARTEPAEWATQMLARSLRWDEALVEALEWRRRTTEDPLAVDLVIATILMELDRPEDATSQLEPHAERLCAERATSPAGLGTWLRALVASGRIGEASSLVEPLLREDALWRGLWMELTAAMDLSQARSALSALESMPGADPAERLMLASAFNQLGRRGGGKICFEEAVRLAQEAAGTESLKATSLLLQGTIAEARGEPAEAEPLYRGVLELEPDNSRALNNLAFVITTTSERHEEALQMVQRALELAPGNPDYLDTLARILVHLGRVPEAAAALRTAFAARPGDVSIGLDLTDMLIAQEHYEEAQAALSKVQRLLDSMSETPEPEQTRADSLSRKLSQVGPSGDF